MFDDSGEYFIDQNWYDSDEYIDQYYVDAAPGDVEDDIEF